jgi:hypothetical protein
MANKLAVAGSDSVFKLPDAEPAGFWAGWWHGTIVPVTFVVSLFKPGVGIYETNNNGAWYNLGFILGAASSLGGGAKVNVNRGEKGGEAGAPCCSCAEDEAIAPESE